MSSRVTTAWQWDGAPALACHRSGFMISSHGGQLLLAQHVPARVVMEILRHSQIALTMNAYSHVAPEVSREAADRMFRALWHDEDQADDDYGAGRGPEDDRGCCSRCCPANPGRTEAIAGSGFDLGIYG